MNHRFCFAIALFVSVATAGAACAQNPDALAGIDHIPLAVRDLQVASENFRRFGFAIKPGRDHAAGIRNRHVKFPDGSGLELITVEAASDELSAAYLEHLKAGEGPAYVSFHVRDAAKLASALARAKIGFDQAAGLTTFKDPRLGFVFITLDNRSPTDRPEHFDHPNGAIAMSEVWIASDDPAPLKELLRALGATSRIGTVRVPEPTEGEVFELQNGRVVIVRAQYQLRAGRPVVGVVMSTKLSKNEATPNERSQASSPGSSLITPSNAHGLWVEFRASGDAEHSLNRTRYGRPVGSNVGPIDDGCVAMLAHQHLSSLAGKSSGFSVGIDVRGQAGFAPAVLVTFTVPAGAPPAQFVGAIELSSSRGTQVLELRRAEYWLLGNASRVATPVEDLPILSPRDKKVDTLYRLFFGVPENAPPEFTLLLPSPVLQGESVLVPPLRFRRAEGKGGLLLCATQ